jgi:GST-like protein
MAIEIGWGKPQKQPIVVHYWGTPNGWKITIMLEECGLPYTIKPVNIGKGEQFEPAFEAISPNMRIPAIVDPEGPDGKPISVFESGAILEYLGRKTGKFYAADQRKLVEVQEWVYWQMANLGPLAGQAHHFRLYAPEKIPYAIERYETQVKRLYVTLNKRLAKRDYICGDYSIADMASFSWARRLERQGQNPDDFPNVKRWLAAIEARPAVVRSLAIKIDVPPSDLKTDEKARQFLFQNVGR